MKTTFTKWDVVDHLKTQEDIAAYIDAAAEEGTPDALPDAFADVFRALGRPVEAAACDGLAAYLRVAANVPRLGIAKHRNANPQR